MTVMQALAAGATDTQDIANRTGLNFLAVAHRLRVLEQEGLVRADHTGTFSTYHRIEQP